MRPGCQSVVELQRLLWLNSPILERQTLLQPLQLNVESGETGMDVYFSLWRCLFSSHSSTRFISPLCAPALTVCLHMLRSADSHIVGIREQKLGQVFSPCGSDASGLGLAGASSQGPGHPCGQPVARLCCQWQGSPTQGRVCHKPSGIPSSSL